MRALYKNIRSRRLELKMSQDLLAKLTGYSDRSSVAKIENGEVDLSESKICEFAKALQTSPQKLTGWCEFEDNISADVIFSQIDVVEVGRRIKKARGSMTLDDVAYKVGVAKSTIQRYENGSITRPKIPVLRSIADALNVNPDWLMCKSDEMSLHKDGRLSSIINCYHLLNDFGKNTAVTRMRELTQIRDYT